MLKIEVFSNVPPRRNDAARVEIDDIQSLIFFVNATGLKSWLGSICLRYLYFFYLFLISMMYRNAGGISQIKARLVMPVNRAGKTEKPQEHRPSMCCKSMSYPSSSFNKALLKTTPSDRPGEKRKVKIQRQVLDARSA